MKLVQFISRRLPLIVLLVINVLIGHGNTPIIQYKKAVPLHPGCAAPLTQTVFYESLPSPLYGAPASGGSCSSYSYSYQWQWSADNVFFQDIPDANSQYLYITNEMNLRTNQPLPQTIYLQRKVTCGAEVQYTNSVSITYVESMPIYARLEVALRDSSYWSTSEETAYDKWVIAYVRFYSDDACTIPYSLPANINYQIRWCTYFESEGVILANECTEPEYYGNIAYEGQTEAFVDDFMAWETYYMTYNYSNGLWEFNHKGWDDYELVMAQNCIIKPPIYPTHIPGYGSQSTLLYLTE